jgi:pyruvate dehydrogenase E2 component (dihydrolipoyllysine-residue acetyltransferase)
MPEIQMPKLSDTMTEGTLVSWRKKIGDQVSAGEVLAEIETDKATMEWEATDDGVLQEIYVPDGGKVNVGERIAFICDGGETAPAQQEKPDKKPAAKAEAKPVEAGVSPAPGQAGGRIKASPLARKIAAGKGIDLTTVKGTGPGGRIVERDVEVAVSAAAPGAKAAKIAASEISAGESTRVSLTGMRKIIAERLVASKGPVPHFYLNIEINADELMRVRAELKSAGGDDETTKITVNDFILKGAVMAAVREPKVNASFAGDAVIYYRDVNLAVAVAIDEGLVTPVIRAAQNESLREISVAVKDLAHRARNKRMKPEEFQGGTLTVSNLGSYGIDNFSAIINPPQAIILAIGAIVRKPVVNEEGAIVSAYRMKIGMSCDHRVVDGATGADYLKALRHLLENPSLLLI